nr:immunoglobulin light chain junction region [Macaca mulatta]
DYYCQSADDISNHDVF